MWWIACAFAGTLVVEPGDLDPDLDLVLVPADAYELRAARAGGLVIGYIPWGGGLVYDTSWVFGLEPSPFVGERGLGRVDADELADTSDVPVGTEPTWYGIMPYVRVEAEVPGSGATVPELIAREGLHGWELAAWPNHNGWMPLEGVAPLTWTVDGVAVDGVGVLVDDGVAVGFLGVPVSDDAGYDGVHLVRVLP